MENNMLTVEQAYKAMFYFLEHQYELTKSDEIGGLLGSMDWTIWADSSKSADPAMWEDWLAAVKRTT
ncbi:hypothetical protein [Serratia liquefaciens]|uniref:hypothetical protein n=1 Tax=Serratia liquefaciens TaxID=614 RepID=UPI0021843C07|nr:hypothetical protein [Serratia liquefaciens]CAI2460115.1 Uncharacterised protein [Serratia liquefaciens]